MTFDSVQTILSVDPGQLKPRMHTLALRSYWTEPGHVIGTHNTTDVSVFTLGTVFTEASIVPRTVF